MTNLCTLAVTAPSTYSATTPVTGLGTPTSITLQSNFAYGSGGTALDAYVQTSLDSGTTWYDIAEFHYTTTTGNQYQNVTNTAVNTATALTQTTLASSTSVNGFLGDRLRVVTNSSGTYVNTTLTINAFPRY